MFFIFSSNLFLFNECNYLLSEIIKYNYTLVFLVSFPLYFNFFPIFVIVFYAKAVLQMPTDHYPCVFIVVIKKPVQGKGHTWLEGWSASP